MSLGSETRAALVITPDYRDIVGELEDTWRYIDWLEAAIARLPGRGLEVVTDVQHVGQMLRLFRWQMNIVRGFIRRITACDVLEKHANAQLVEDATEHALLMMHGDLHSALPCWRDGLLLATGGARTPELEMWWRERKLLGAFTREQRVCCAAEDFAAYAAIIRWHDHTEAWSEAERRE